MTHNNDGKTHNRHRNTAIEESLFQKQCIDLHKKGWSVNRIAFELNAREAKVKLSLADFILTHKDEFVEANMFLAKKTTAIQKIYKEKQYADFYECQFYDDGSIILTPIKKQTSTDEAQS